MTVVAKRKGTQCFYHYHNDNCFGLGKNDCSLLLKGKKGDWEPPSTDDIAENAQHVSNLQKSINPIFNGGEQLARRKCPLQIPLLSQLRNDTR